MAHYARQSRLEALYQTVPCVVIFQGPNSFISPSWYPSKHAHGKAVPTWNYAVVHAHGLPAAVEDRNWLLEHVTALSTLHESERPAPWRVSDAPPDYVDTLLKAIVGIEIPIARLVGKWKTSQNRTLPDKLGTIAGLHERGDDLSQQMAALVERHAL